MHADGSHYQKAELVFTSFRAGGGQVVLRYDSNPAVPLVMRDSHGQLTRLTVGTTQTVPAGAFAFVRLYA